MYKVYIAPLLTSTTWEDEQEVTDYVQDGGIGRIKVSIDSEDFDFGLFTFNDITIKLENIDGKFNDVSDNRSIFRYKRNESKVRITYTDNNGTEVNRFKGIINEEGTKVDPYQDDIKFKILSYDSVLRNTKIEAGLLSDGITSTNAFKLILDRTSITKILVYDVSNINPANDYVLDKASKFDNKKTSEVLSELLKITNSVFLIDDDDEMIVKDREPYSVINNFYGPFDYYSRENIIKVKKYNTGRHRLFTSVKIGSVEASDSGYQLEYGFKQKEFTIDYVEVEATLTTIAENLADEFKAEKIEMQVSVPIEQFVNTEIMQLARVFYPLRTERKDGFIPIIGVTTIGDTGYRLPIQYGSLEVRNNMAFKIIAIDERPKSKELDFKLRQIGSSDEDGYFSELPIAIVGLAIIGNNNVESGGTGPFYAPYLHAAIVGSSIVST